MQDSVIHHLNNWGSISCCWFILIYAGSTNWIADAKARLEISKSWGHVQCFFRNGQLHQPVNYWNVSVLLNCEMCLAKLTLPWEGCQFLHSRFGRLLNAFHFANWLTLRASSDKSWAPLLSDQTNLTHEESVSSHLASFSCFVSQFFYFSWMKASLRQTTESNLMTTWGPKHRLTQYQSLTATIFRLPWR